MSLLVVRPVLTPDGMKTLIQHITTAGRYLGAWPRPERRRGYWEVEGIPGGHFIGSNTLGRGRTEYFKNYKPCQNSK